MAAGAVAEVEAAGSVLAQLGSGICAGGNCLGLQGFQGPAWTHFIGDNAADIVVHFQHVHYGQIPPVPPGILEAAVVLVAPRQGMTPRDRSVPPSYWKMTLSVPVTTTVTQRLEAVIAVP